MNHALEQLLQEYPELASDWPRGDLLDMLGSVSPRMSAENGRIQARYWELVRSHEGEAS